MRRQKWMIWIAVLLLALTCSVCAAGEETKELHPQLITITGGQGVGDGSYINHNNSNYPFVVRFDLSEDFMPAQSCQLGVNSYDCDEDGNSWHTMEYDMVFVNGSFVGVLTGSNDKWKTSYFSVPLEALVPGENTIIIYVGHKEKSNGAIVRDTDDWLLTVQRLSLQMDGGVSAEAPEHFSISLDYANRTETGIICGASVTIESEQERSYVIEYSLVDKTGSESPTNNQIVADDEKSVSGTSINSTGVFYLNSDAPMGNYEIQATLVDPMTGEVYAFTSKTFDLGEALEGACKHEAMGPAVFVCTEYSRLNASNENYSLYHQAIDQYSNTCAKCGKTFPTYTNMRMEAHTGQICSKCGYVPENYNGILSATLAAVNHCTAGEQFIVTVKTSDIVNSLSAINSNGTAMKNEWTRVDNGDGTITWSRIYTANIPKLNQYWTISAYTKNNRPCGTMDTNALDIHEAGSETFEEGFVDPWKELLNIGQSGVIVLDGDTGKAVSGATVTVMSQTGLTTANGSVVFEKKDLSGKGLAVKAQGYFDYEDSGFRFNSNATMEVVTIYKSVDAKVVPLKCNDDNISTGTAQLNTEANLAAEITVKGMVNNGAKIVEYKLLQNGAELATSKDGTFKVRNSKFSKGAALKVEMTVESNGQQSKVDADLPITIVSQGIGNVLNTGGIPILKNVKLGVQGLPEILNQSSFDFGDFMFDIDDAEYTVGNYVNVIGFGVKLGANVDQKNVPAGKIGNIFGKAVEQTRSKYNVGLYLEPAFYSEYRFNETGYYHIRSTARIGAGGFLGGEYHLWIGNFPILVEWKFTPSGSFGYTQSEYIKDSAAKAPDEYDLDVTIEIEGGGGPGVGASALNIKATIQVYGRITLNVNGKLIASSPVRINGGGTIKGEIGLRAIFKAGIFSWEPELPLIQLSTPEPVKLSRNTLESQPVRAQRVPLPDNARLTASATATDAHYVSSVQEQMTLLEADTDIISGVRLGQAEDKMVMVYLVNDSKAESGVQYGHIVYRVWTGAEWSAPIDLDDGSLPEGEPALASDGKNLYIAFEQLNRPVDEIDLSADPLNTPEAFQQIAEHLLTPTEIAVARFDPAAGQFVSLGRITSDEVYDSDAAIALVNGEPAVIWAQHETADMTRASVLCAAPDGQNGWNTEILATGLENIIEIAAGNWNGGAAASVLSSVEADDAINSAARLYLAAKNSPIQEIAEGSVDHPLFAQTQATDALLWYGDDRIQALTAGGSPRTIAEGSRVFRAVTDGTRAYVCYPVYNGTDSTDIYLLDINEEQALSISAATVSGYVDSLDAVAGSNGLYFAILRADVDYVGGAMQVKTDLYATAYAYRKSAQLLALDWDTAGWLPGETAAFEALVANTGSEPITQVHVDIAGSQPGAQDLAVEIAPGNMSFVEFAYVLPAEMKGSAIISITADGQEIDPDNSVTVPLEFLDLAVSGSQLLVSGSNSLYLTVMNIGTVPGSCSLIVHQDNADGPVLFSQYIELDAQTVDARIVPMDGYLKKIAGGTEKTVYIELSVTGSDLVEENNSTYVVFRNLANP